jgi:hypothetical protein
MTSPLEALAAHPFAFIWHRDSPSSADEAAIAISEIERVAADLIIQNEPDPVSRSTFRHLFMPYHQNGTFSIGVRRAPITPPFLRGESGNLATWVKTVARSDLVRMLFAQVLPLNFDSHRIDHIAAVVSDAFHYRASSGRLYDQIPNQNYIDYVRRVIGLYVYHDANFEFHTEGDYNEFVTEVVLRNCL